MGRDIAVGVDEGLVAADLDDLPDENDILPHVRVEIAACDARGGDGFHDQIGVLAFSLLVFFNDAMSGSYWLLLVGGILLLGVPGCGTLNCVIDAACVLGDCVAPFEEAE
jgi:hypothetical protein